LLLDTTSYNNMLQRLEPAHGVGRDLSPFLPRRNWLALSAWRRQPMLRRRQWLDVIANDGRPPASLRSRAEALQAFVPPVCQELKRRADKS